MELYAPTYFENFKCLGGACPRSCCIGWEIDIDPNTLEDYRKNQGEMYDRIRASIDESCTPHFRLTENGRCPHLNSKGLCDIISSLGDVALCHICREHPRYYNPLSTSVEVGLGIACPEAARLILETEYPFSVEKTDYPPPNTIYPVQDAVHEEWIYKQVLSSLCRILDEGRSVEEILSAIIHFGLWADDAQYFSNHRTPPEKTYPLLSLDSIIDDYICIIEQAFPLLEALDDSLIPRVIDAARGNARNPAALKERLSTDKKRYISKLLFYFIHRYLSGAILDLKWAERLMLSTTLALALYFLSFSEGISLTDAAVNFSASIEYSTDNTERLLDYLTERFF